MNKIWDSHIGAEKQIDRSVKWRLKIMRNNIPEDIISKDFLNFMIYTLLSDQTEWWIKDSITNWYEMKDSEGQKEDPISKQSPTILNNIPSVRLTKNVIKELKNIKTFRKWFEIKKKEKSYVRSKGFKNGDAFENNFKEKIKNHDLRDVALNEILEFAMADFVEDLVEKVLKQKKNVKDVKVYKTNHYDDVMAHVDFVLEVEFLWNKEKEYSSFDFTTSHDIANIERKEKLEWVYCRDFAYNNWIKWKIPRGLMIIDDMEVVFNYLNDYVKYVLAHNGNINKGDALKTFDNMKIFWTTHNIENVKRDIKRQLLGSAA